MNQKPPKSAAVAGLLGIFLGSVGAHNWYLGEKKKGIIHLCLFGAGILIVIIAAVMTASALSSFNSLVTAVYFAPALYALGGIVIGASGLWGLIEGIIVITKGDAGLAAKGIATAGTPVAQPAAAPANTVPSTTPDNGNSAAGTNDTAAQGGSDSSATSGSSDSSAANSSEGAATPTAGGTTIAASAATPAPAVAAPQPKQPMNPATKKKIILGCALGGGVVILAIVAVIVITSMLKVDYAEAYKTARELRSDVNKIYNDYSCQRVKDYAASSSTTIKSYDDYVNECLEVGAETSKLVDKLGNTDGVKKNTAIKDQFDAFKVAFDKSVVPAAQKEAALKKYQVWHKFVVELSDLGGSIDQSDADLTRVSKILIDSEYDDFKSYGEARLKLMIDTANAYRAYRATSYSDKNRSELKATYDRLYSDYQTFNKEYPTKSFDFGEIEGEEVSKMRSEYNKLVKMIAETYEENYNFGSNDCGEYGSRVDCDY